MTSFRRYNDVAQKSKWRHFDGIYPDGIWISSAGIWRRNDAVLRWSDVITILFRRCGCASPVSSGSIRRCLFFLTFQHVKMELRLIILNRCRWHPSIFNGGLKMKLLVKMLHRRFRRINFKRKIASFISLFGKFTVKNLQMYTSLCTHAVWAMPLCFHDEYRKK